MLIVHVHIMGKHGNIERTYDFMRNDGKDELEGCDVVIPYDKEYQYPISERDAIAIIRNQDMKGEH
jgi:hypothetical protein